MHVREIYADTRECSSLQFCEMSPYCSEEHSNTCNRYDSKAYAKCNGLPADVYEIH